MRTLPLTIGTIHFVGIGGIGMSGIAEILHNLGYAVQGSDVADGANVKRIPLWLQSQVERWIEQTRLIAQQIGGAQTAMAAHEDDVLRRIRHAGAQKIGCYPDFERGGFRAGDGQTGNHQNVSETQQHRESGPGNKSYFENIAVTHGFAPTSRRRTQDGGFGTSKE